MSRASLARRKAAERQARRVADGAPVACFCDGRGYMPVRLVDPQPVTACTASTGGGAVECPCRKAAPCGC